MQLYLPVEVRKMLDGEVARLEREGHEDVSRSEAIRILILEIRRLRVLEERVVAAGIDAEREPTRRGSTLGPPRYK